jgi:tetratricopeptide (TPR) repeat protein
MKRFMITFLLLVYCFAGKGGSVIPSERSTEAFQKYASGDFEAARTLYIQLVDRYGPSSDLFYNIAICELAMHHINNAKLSFEKALLLKPANSKIKMQLAAINETIEPKIEALPPFLLYKWFISIRDLLNQFSWGWVTLILGVLLGFIGTLKHGFNKFIPLYIWTISLSCFFLSIIFYFSRVQYEETLRGIIMESVPLKVAPASNAQELIPLGAGTKLEIKDSLQVWYKVQLENNDQGWIQKSNIQKI